MMPTNNYILTPDGNFVSESELYHYGILGMKWGVRKYQNPDGSLTAKGKKRYQTDASGRMTAKGAKNWYKDNRNELINRSIDHDNEFDKTDEGKKLKNSYDKEIRRMYNDDNWSDNQVKQNQFHAAEESYLRKQAEYTAKKIISEYGREKATIYASRGKVDSGQDAVKLLSDQWWIHAI